MRENDNNVLANGAKAWDLTCCKKARVSTWLIFHFAGLVAPMQTCLAPRQQLTAKGPWARV